MQQVTRHNTKHTTHNTSRTTHHTNTQHTYHNTLQDSTIQSIHHQSTTAPNALHRTPQKQSFHKALTGTCCEAFSKLQWFDEAQYCNGKVNSIDWDLRERTCFYHFFWYQLKFPIVYCGWVGVTSLSCLGHGSWQLFLDLKRPPSK